MAIEVTDPRPTRSTPRLDGGGMFGSNAELAAAFGRLYGTIHSHGCVDFPTKEVVRMRNARVTDCRLCRNVRFDKAREHGLTEELVNLIDDGYENTPLSARHKLALEFTDAFLMQPGEVNDDLKQRLLAEFGTDQLVELSAILALFLNFARIVVATGSEPENMPTTVLPTPDFAPAVT